MPWCQGPGCSAEIVWAFNPVTQRVMPLDVEPDPAGNVEAEWDDRMGVPVISAVHPSATTFMAMETVWMPHWATCPNADEFRKK